MTVAVTDSASRPAGWLLGPRFDGVFLFMPVVLALSFAFVGSISTPLLLLAVTVDIWLLGYHHVIATFTKLAGTAEDRKQNFFLIYVLPPLVLLGVVLTAYFIGTFVVVTVYFFWQWYHYARQSYGIATFYRRKAPYESVVPPWAMQALIWAMPVYGVLNRSTQNADTFLNLPIWLPQVPALVTQAAGVIALAVCAVWVAERVMAARKGTLSKPQTIFIASHLLVFYLGYVAIDDMTIGWLAANVWHNLQYILFVWLYNTNRFGQSPAPDALIGRLSRRSGRHILAYFGFTMLATTLAYGAIKYASGMAAGGDRALEFTLIVIVVMTFNFHHYIVDSVIWKARTKSNAAVMGIPPA